MKGGRINFFSPLPSYVISGFLVLGARYQKVWIQLKADGFTTLIKRWQKEEEAQDFASLVLSTNSWLLRTKQLKKQSNEIFGDIKLQKYKVKTVLVLFNQCTKACKKSTLHSFIYLHPPQNPNISAETVLKQTQDKPKIYKQIKCKSPG